MNDASAAKGAARADDLFDPAGASPEGRTADEIAGATAKWTVGDCSSGDVALTVRRFIVADRRRPESRLVELVRLARRSPKDKAPALAARLVEAQQGVSRREAARLTVAVALAPIDRTVGETLFREGSSWTPNRPECVAAAILYVERGGGWRPWDLALLDAIDREASGPLKGRAVAARLAVTKYFAEDRAAFRDAVIAAIRHRGRTRGLAPLAAELVWLSEDWAMTQPIFGRFPGFGRAAGHNPLLASLAWRAAWHRVPRSARPAARAFALQVAELERMSAAFWRRVADPALRIAVVGNSPCETGLGKGAEIDAHDLVVRFNDAPEEAGAFGADYGERCDVKVFAKRSSLRWASSRAKTIVLTRQDGMLANEMEAPAAIMAAGREAAYVPHATLRALRRRLGAGPSTGMVFLATLRELRGSLQGVSRYGFALVDQLGKNATSSHYFAEGRAHGGHPWRAERALLDEWIAEARDGAARP